MTKKILALALAAMMICTCMISVNAAALEHGPGSQDPLPEPWVTVDDQDDTKVRYFLADGTDYTESMDGWTNGQAADGWQFFDGGHQYLATGTYINYCEGNYATFTFTGDAVAMFTQYRNSKSGMAAFDVYIDGELVASVSDAGPESDNDTSRYILFQKEGLSAAEHVMKVVTTTAGQLAFDGFGYIPCEVETPGAPSTGDATIAAIAIAAVASLGAVLVIGKKR